MNCSSLLKGIPTNTAWEWDKGPTAHQMRGRSTLVEAAVIVPDVGRRTRPSREMTDAERDQRLRGESSMSRLPGGVGASGGSSGVNLSQLFAQREIQSAATTSRKMNAIRPQFPGVTISGSITGGGALERRSELGSGRLLQDRAE